MPSPSFESHDQFEALLSEHREPLRRFLVSLTASTATADDLVQETCVTLWKKRAEFIPGTNFKAWSFQVAFNLARNFRRKAARAKELALPDEELLEKLRENYDEADLRWELESKHLPHCLHKLREKQRELIIRRYVGKVPVQELAQEGGMTPNAMSQLLFRIKQTLRKCVEDKIASEREASSS